MLPQPLNSSQDLEQPGALLLGVAAEKVAEAAAEQRQDGQAHGDRDGPLEDRRTGSSPNRRPAAREADEEGRCPGNSKGCVRGRIGEAAAGREAAAQAWHAVGDARTAAKLLRCDATALDRYDAADPTDLTDPTARCAGIARRLRAKTGAGEAAPGMRAAVRLPPPPIPRLGGPLPSPPHPLH